MRLFLTFFPGFVTRGAGTIEGFTVWMVSCGLFCFHHIAFYSTLLVYFKLFFELKHLLMFCWLLNDALAKVSLTTMKINFVPEGLAAGRSFGEPTQFFSSDCFLAQAKKNVSFSLDFIYLPVSVWGARSPPRIDGVY